MKNDILISRYAEGLAGALHSAGEYEAVLREISEFAGLLGTHELLKATLLRPFVPAARKAGVLEEVLAHQGYAEKTRRLVTLLAQRGRLEILADIARILPALWKTRQGVVTFDVRSVVPLTGAQRAALEATLAAREKKPVSCVYGLDAAIVGGLVVRKGNRVYDASLKGELERLKEIIRER
jgi:F-type H+-transporting ATPase subunit delta